MTVRSMTEGLLARRWGWLLLILGLFAIGGALRPGAIPVAEAAVFTVDTLTDGADALLGDGVCATAVGSCTLRAAVAEANLFAGPDTIVIPPGLYFLQTSPDAVNTILTGDLNVTDDLVIRGDGDPADVVIDANTLDRLFAVQRGVSLTLERLTLQRGSARDGGAIRNEGTLTLRDVVLIDHSVSGAGQPAGGAIWNSGTALLENVTIRRSTGASLGGAIWNSGDLQLTGGVIEDNTAAGAGAIWSSGSVTITDTRIAGNTAETAGGGALRNGPAAVLTLVRATVEGNLARQGDGGGILNAGDLSLEGTTVRSNRAPAGSGGGISSSGPVTVEASTISANTAAGSGGGLWLADGASLAMVNATVSGNAALQRGGGIALAGAASRSIRYSTIAANISGESGGGLALESGATLAIGRSIVATNRPADCGGDAALAPTSEGANLDGDGSCSFDEASDQPGVDPLLAPLRNNGGATRTQALRRGSPAVDLGSDPAAPATDQRGTPRTDGRPDSGAYEAEPNATTLYPGWNLIAWQGAATTISQAIGGACCIDVVFSFDPLTQTFIGFWADAAIPISVDFALVPGLALWVHSTAEDAVPWAR